MPPTHFADLIRTYMRTRDLNQADAARLCDFSESQMSSLLNRERKGWPDAETVLKLGRLGITPGEVMDAAARDLGIGPLYDETLRISQDPDVRATVQVIEGLGEEDRRRLRRIAAAYLSENGGDKK